MLFPGQTIEIQAKRAKLVFNVIIGIPLTFGCLAMLIVTIANGESTAKGVLIGVAGTLLFGLGLVMSVYRLLKRGPLLVLNEKGVTDYSRREPRFMAWGEIGRVHAYDMVTLLNRTSFLTLVPRDATRFIKDWPEAKRMRAEKRKEPYRMVITEYAMPTKELGKLIMDLQAKYGSPEAPPVFAGYPRN